VPRMSHAGYLLPGDSVVIDRAGGQCVALTRTRIGIAAVALPRIPTAAATVTGCASAHSAASITSWPGRKRQPGMRTLTWPDYRGLTPLSESWIPGSSRATRPCHLKRFDRLAAPHLCAG
jgi:hypothetical protein